MRSKRIDLPPGVLQPREAVLNMAPYSPPTGGRAGKLRLDFNENTVGASPKVIEYLREHLSEASVLQFIRSTARSSRSSRNSSASSPTISSSPMEPTKPFRYWSIPISMTAVRCFYCSHPTRCISFYTEVAGASIREIPYRAQKLAFPLEELLDAIRPSTRAILIANPNNPTGTGTSRAGMERILEKASNAAVLIDEAYYEFSGVTALPLLNDYPNLFVSRTFSKSTAWRRCVWAACSRSPAMSSFFTRRNRPTV